MCIHVHSGVQSVHSGGGTVCRQEKACQRSVGATRATTTDWLDRTVGIRTRKKERKNSSNDEERATVAINTDVEVGHVTADPENPTVISGNAVTDGLVKTKTNVDAVIACEMTAEETNGAATTAAASPHSHGHATNVAAVRPARRTLLRHETFPRSRNCPNPRSSPTSMPKRGVSCGPFRRTSPNVWADTLSPRGC